MIYKYFACPNEAACGERNLTVPLDGEVITREVEKYTNNQFVLDDVCNYLI